MLAAEAAELLELKPIRRVPLILGRGVSHLFAVSALKQNLVSHETSIPSGAIKTTSSGGLHRTTRKKKNYP